MSLLIAYVLNIFIPLGQIAVTLSKVQYQATGSAEDACQQSEPVYRISSRKVYRMLFTRGKNSMGPH